ncbi:Atxe2 family lasso peptide isopeptidase [Asticcacaulis taihuensis]|uniref:Atxe2 family lasso peptide isopeptidase n=1 Tax=Asticcacaulis taihuensis TaxID=260084 RepID=UPI001FE0D889|nr:Atxe2 family lasso peptide isopeptidase [Asticcacaulis taihuensis]
MRSRTVTAKDLIELRDIGPVANTDIHAQILSVSPNGQSIAFQQRQANIATNSYCLEMYTLRLDGKSAPVRIDRGGEFFHATYSQLGFAAFTSPGPMPTITPHWSPDGQWIAYLRRDGGITQVWRAQADGTGGNAVSRLAYDVDDLAWTSDGTGLIVSARPALAVAKADIEKEGLQGYLYDERFAPVSGSVPVPREPIDIDVTVIDVVTGASRPATAQEKTMLSAPPVTGKPAEASAFYPGPNDQAAWTVADDPKNLFSAKTLHVRWHDGRVANCLAEVCGPVSSLWWSRDGREVYVLRAGWQTERTDLLRWRFGQARPEILLSTTDVLIGCSLANEGLVCGHETSIRPRAIVGIDLASGKVATLYDPNPEVPSLELGQVTRLHWKNAFGIQTWGDLVLPPDHVPGQIHPLVVVQYESRGFLRGGTGEEYPIQLLAANGMAVLSFQRPASLGVVHGVATFDELNAYDMTDWADRRSIQSALDSGIDAAIATGTIDASKVGLTGLSDGATTTQFALINHPRYAAVAMSSCCSEPDTMSVLVGDATRTWFAKMGYPALSQGDSHFWAPISLEQNAAKIDTPMLMQLSDREYLDALAARTALVEQSKPVEVYVFPNEYHVKWQPQHRLAVYQRSVDWFGFWLQGREDPDPAKARQYERWHRLKR